MNESSNKTSTWCNFNLFQKYSCFEHDWFFSIKSKFYSLIFRFAFSKHIVLSIMRLFIYRLPFNLSSLLSFSIFSFIFLVSSFTFIFLVSSFTFIVLVSSFTFIFLVSSFIFISLVSSFTFIFLLSLSVSLFILLLISLFLWLSFFLFCL